LTADRVVMLFVFMPLVRVEITEFMLNKNEYPTRAQHKRVDHVAGVPNKLYDQRDDYSFKEHSLAWSK
jgi:hypothetical protein